MSQRTTATKPERASHHVAAARPIWVLMPGCQPVLWTGRKHDFGDATKFCYEDDSAWRPIAELTGVKKGG